jgi:uncharacterized membrane protein YfcA
MSGVSGAFMLLPFQISVLGFNTPAVSATNQLFNIVAIPGGVYRYVREGRMVWPLAWVVIAGTLPGVLAGAVIRVKYLPDPVRFKIFAAFVLLYIGYRLVRDILSAPDRSGKGGRSAEEEFQELVKNFNADAGEMELPRIQVREFTLASISYDFYGRNFTVNTFGISALSLIVGIVGGVYGIGGGAIIAPFFVSFFNLPVYTVAGAALMGTFVTSVAGVAFYQLLAPFYPGMSVAPDWLLGFLFGIGGTAGMYCGARVQKFMPARVIKIILAASIFFVAAKYLWAYTGV